ncbi:MAG TPA: AMP-binding protein, partial [Flavisolibacter sp.]
MLQDLKGSVFQKEHQTHEAWTDVILLKENSVAEDESKTTKNFIAECTSYIPTLERIIVVTLGKEEVVITIETISSSKNTLPPEIILGRCREVLLSISTDPEQRIDTINILSGNEKALLLEEFNSSSVVYPGEETILGIFKAHATSYPDAIALVFENEKLSYAELDRRSTQVATALTSLGIKPGTQIPIFLERGTAFMIGLLGILKTGCAYVPIDPEIPTERLNDILDDLAARVILLGNTQAANITTILPNKEEQLPWINIEAALPDPGHTANDTTPISPEDLVYVMYTSGSTGKPKGVMVRHRNLMDYLYGLDQAIAIRQCKSFAVVSTFAADLGNTVIFGSLFTGGTLHILSKERAGNPAQMHHYFNEHSIDCLKVV